MADKPKGNKFMFYTGMALILITVILFLGNFMGESSAPIVLGIIGIVLMGASKYNLLE